MPTIRRFRCGITTRLTVIHSRRTRCVFNNLLISSIGKLSAEAIRAVLDELLAHGRECLSPASFALNPTRGSAEWANKEKTKMLLLWKKPEEWALIIEKWVRSPAYVRSPSTSPDRGWPGARPRDAGQHLHALRAPPGRHRRRPGYPLLRPSSGSDCFFCFCCCS